MTNVERFSKILKDLQATDAERFKVAQEDIKDGDLETYAKGTRGEFDELVDDIEGAAPDSLVVSRLRGIACDGIVGYQKLTKEQFSIGHICELMAVIYAAKNADYGDSFSNSLNRFGIIAAAVRMSDKIERLISLSSHKKKQQVADESLSDTFLDLACYAVMTISWMQSVSLRGTVDMGERTFSFEHLNGIENPTP